MTPSTTTTLALALCLLLPTGACDLEEPSEAPRAAWNDDAEARPAHPADLPPPVLLLELAVERGGIANDPTMAEALAVLERSHAEAVAAHDALRSALAEALATGRLTTEALSPPLAVITTTAEREAQALTLALDTAHERLDPELRTQVVDALPEPPAPPSLEDRAPPPDGRGHRPPPPGGGSQGHGPMADLLAVLELDEQQRESLGAALGEPRRPEPPAPLDLAAFADEGFDASTLGLVQLHARRQTERATHQVELLVALVPLLDEEQRAVLAELLDAPPPAPTRSARG